MSDPFLGEIRMFAGNFAPRSWALCDGQLLQVSQNDALFSLFGTIYGGDGRTTFGLPDLRGRIPIHQGSGPGLSSRPIGEEDGSETVTLTANQLAGHDHAVQCVDAPGTSDSPENATWARNSSGLGYATGAAASLITVKADAIGSVGGSQAHTNIMPFLCINFIVALVGVYPSRT